jgi:hypothetical protein
MPDIVNKIAVYILIVICLISFFGGMVYYFHALDIIGIAITLILTAAGLFLFAFLDKKYNKSKTRPMELLKKRRPTTYYPLPTIIFLTSYFLLLTSCFYILLTNQTTDAIISPWQVLPWYFFLLYGLATLILFITISYNLKAISFLLTAHYFLSFSVAAFAYRLGYGFDPFVHEATMDLIDKAGAVEPKPFYYLGYYSFIVIIHKLTALPLFYAQKFLLPVLSALLLPVIAFGRLASVFDNRKNAALTLVFLLALPYSFFILSTPQNLAWLFLLLAIMISLKCRNYFELGLICLLSLAALMIQPVAGLPALFLAAMTGLFHSDIGYKKHLYRMLFFLAAAAVPLAFFIFQNTSSTIPAAPEIPDTSQATAVRFTPAVPNPELPLSLWF